jgi:SSS family solute:Na+ symporter
MLEFISGIGWCLFSIGIVTVQFSAIASLLTNYCPYGYNFCATIFAIIVILYSSIGGITSVVKTDLIQFLFFGITLPIAAYIAIESTGGIQ